MIYRDEDSVFRFVSNFTNDIYWRSGILSMSQSTKGFTEAGTFTKETIRILGIEWINVAKITSYKKNQKVSFKVVKGIDGVSGYRSVYPISVNCTGFIYCLNLNPSGLLKYIAPLIQNSFRRRVRKDLAKLKNLLEQKHSIAA